MFKEAIHGVFRANVKLCCWKSKSDEEVKKEGNKSQEEKFIL